MTGKEINTLTRKFEGEYPDGGYVSRMSIWREAMDDGKVTEDQFMEAKKYYGSLWNYTGD